MQRNESKSVLDEVRANATLQPFDGFKFDGQIVVRIDDWMVERGLFESKADIKRWERDPQRQPVVVFTKHSTFDFMFLDRLRGVDYALWPGEAVMVGRNMLRSAYV